MGLLFNNWLEEGYYEDDGYGYTKIEDIKKIRELQNTGMLYKHDGMSMNKVTESDVI